MMDTRTMDMTDTSFTHEPEEEQDYKTKKHLALYEARTVLSMIGTMEERRTSRKQLKRMCKLGIGAV